MLKGSLFTREFLTEGIQAYPEWQKLTAKEMAAFRTRLLEVFQPFPLTGHPNESQTERDLIDPVIEALGFANYLTQQTTSKKGRSDIPDYLLLENAEQKAKANSEKEQSAKYRHGIAIVEAKAWQIPLDRKSGMDADSVPSNQILRYLSRVETASDRRMRWGVLTNGRLWRLYYQGAKSRSEDFLELDLPLILGLTGFQ